VARFRIGVQVAQQDTTIEELRSAWREADEHADAWNSFGPPSTFRHKNQVMTVPPYDLEPVRRILDT
jgi:hypothetical protein